LTLGEQNSKTNIHEVLTVLRIKKQLASTFLFSLYDRMRLQKRSVTWGECIVCKKSIVCVFVLQAPCTHCVQNFRGIGRDKFTRIASMVFLALVFIKFLDGNSLHHIDSDSDADSIKILLLNKKL
jgi:hypothetical protein